MGVIERLQHLDERLGLDSPRKLRDQAERRAALASLPETARRSLARRRFLAIAVIVAAVVTAGLSILRLLPPDDDGWIVVTIALTFIATILGDLAGRRIERRVLAKHREGSGREQ